MLPMICYECQSHMPGYNGLFHAKDFLTPCPNCGAQGKPATLIHLAIPCSLEESHPEMKGGKKFLNEVSVSSKIACGYGPRIPKSLTNSPEAATCFHCLKAYRQLNQSPENSESQT